MIEISHSYPTVTEEDVRAVTRAMRDCSLAQGAVTQAFEKKIAETLQAAGAVATSRGGAALVLGLRALGMQRGDEVILPTYVCRAVLESVLCVGASPILCDVGPGWNMTPETVAPHIRSKTKAIIVVHQFGIDANVDSFRPLGVPIIEDACQAFGGLASSGPLGSAGDVGFVSFQATKIISTGEGGALFAKNPETLKLAKKLRDGDDVSWSTHEMTPFTDIQAALGLSQLARLSSFVSRRSEIAERYHREVVDRFGLRSRPREGGVPTRFPIAVSKPHSELRRAFLAQGVHVRQGVDALLHRLGGLPDAHFPNAVARFEETLSLPIYPGLTDESLARIIDVCAKTLSA